MAQKAVASLWQRSKRAAVRYFFPWPILVLVLAGLAGFVSSQLQIAVLLKGQGARCTGMETFPFCAQFALGYPLGWLEALSTTVLGAGIAGAVLKIIATEGYFLDAVSNVVFGRQGIERMDDATRLRVWRDLTNAIYLPFPRNGGAHISGRPDFEERFSSAIDHVCDYEEDYLLQKVDRTIKIVWDDKEGGNVLRIESWFKANVIPYDPTQDVQYKIKRRVGVGQKLAPYNPTDKVFIQRSDEDIHQFQRRIASGQSEQMILTKQTDEEDERIINIDRLNYNFSEKEYCFSIERRVKLKLNLHNDNVYEMVPSVPIDGISLRVQNFANGVTVQLCELGWKEKLAASNGSQRTLLPNQDGVYDSSDVFLPHEGCLLIFNRLPAA